MGDRAMNEPASDPCRLPAGDVAGLVSLNECPPGLFEFNGHYGFKSEYTTMLEDPRRYQCDAYCLESGEYFWGGASGTEVRGKLLVRPIEAADLIERLAGAVAGERERRNEATILLAEIIGRQSSRDFYGLGEALFAKLATVQATLNRATRDAEREGGE